MAIDAGTVPRGHYYGFTKAELHEELERYKDAIKGAGSDIESMSIGGESFAYGPRRDLSLGQWQYAIQEAFALLDPTTEQAPARAAVVSMRF